MKGNCKRCNKFLKRVGPSGHCIDCHKTLFTGENSPHWKGGVMMDNRDKYVKVRCEGHPRAKARGHYVQEHILVMEKALGRYLKEGEIVHHKNHNRRDNRIENLQLTDPSEHQKIHGKERTAEALLRRCRICGEKQRCLNLCDNHYANWRYHNKTKGVSISEYTQEQQMLVPAKPKPET
jgi:hypothetical protein